ncbi:MAG TPA: hypothetical protein VMY05_00905 [Acidobacteriota bacterium]|nr:hypothetical protein [Acidobacteriota bacterium]
MEHLIDVKGMGFEQVMADSVTRDAVCQEMMVWRTLLKGRNQPPVD